jgi:hypothetical protein
MHMKNSPDLAAAVQPGQSGGCREHLAGRLAAVLRVWKRERGAMAFQLAMPDALVAGDIEGQQRSAATWPAAR